MHTPQRRRPVGDKMYASITVGPPSAAGLASWEAQLVGIEAGLAQQELEADGGELERVAGELGAQCDELR